MNKLIFVCIGLSLCLCSCTKMRAAAWYSHYGLERQDLGQKKAVPALTRALKDRNVYVRIYSAKELGIIGPAATEAIPALVNTLADPTPQIRMESAKALSLIGLSDHPEQLSNISKLLRDTNSGVRLYAASAIGTMGEKALSVSSYLLYLTDDEHPAVRREAMNAIHKINYKEADFIAKLKIIKSSDINIINQNVATAILHDIQ